MSQQGWTTVKFGDVVENVRHNIKDRNAAGIDRVLGLDDIETGNLHVTGWKDIDSSPSFRTHFKPTQTLFGKRRAYLRKVAYAEFEGVCTQNILVFETKNPEVLLPELLPFICMSESFMIDAVKHSTGSLFPNANWNAIRDYEFRLPPIDIQYKILKILESAREILDSYRQVSQLSQVALKSSITSMCQKLKNSNNEEKTLKEIAFFRRGHDLSKRKRIVGSIPIYGANGISGFHNESISLGPGVMTGRSGTIGKLHYCDGPYWPLNTCLYVEDFFENNPKFIYYLLHSIL